MKKVVSSSLWFIPLLILQAAHAQTANIHYKKYENTFQVTYSDGQKVDVAIEMDVDQSESPGFNDRITILAKNSNGSRSTGWAVVSQDQHVRFSQLTYTQDLSPSVPQNREITLSLRYDNEAIAADQSAFRYLGSDLASIEMRLEAIKAKISESSPWVVSNTPSPAEIAKAGQPNYVTTDDATIVEKDQKFSISREGRLLKITRADGKSVKFSNGGAMVIDYSVEDGILSVKGSSRKIDLWKFDDEVSFVGNTSEPKALATSEGKMIDVTANFENSYTDLVAKARQQMAEGSAVELTSELSPSSDQMINALQMDKSVRLLGAPGSGKTTEVEVLAQLVAEGRVNGIPRTAKIPVISLMDLEAGTKYVGEMEIKLQTLLAYMEAYKPVGMIDEFHAIAGVGVTEGNSANIGQKMKPAIEKGLIRVIGISTDGEWANAFGNDPAWDQRFKTVNHQEPSGAELIAKIENSFRIKRKPMPSVPAIKAAIEISNRFDISGAQPRKAVNLLLEATSVAGIQSATPAAVKKAALSFYNIDAGFFNSSVMVGRLQQLNANMQKEVIGQERAISETQRVFERVFTGVGDGKSANAVLFNGAFGTGKKLIGTTAAESMGYKTITIDMSKYATGDLQAFQYEVYLGLKKSPTTAFVLSNIEQAHPAVQESLVGIMKGNFTVNFRDNTGKYIFIDVKCPNAVFFMTTTLEVVQMAPRAAVGFNAPLPTLKGIPMALNQEALIKGGISPNLLAQISSDVSLSRPTAEQFEEKLRREIMQTLARESSKQKVKFEVSNLESMVKGLASTYSAHSNYSQVSRMIEKSLEVSMTKALIASYGTKQKTVSMQWSTELNALTQIDCNQVIRGK